MTNREPLTAALLLFWVADYQKNLLGNEAQKGIYYEWIRKIQNQSGIKKNQRRN